MKDYGISVLEQYQMEIHSTRRIRGAVLCDTDKGLFLLKETTVTAGRLPVLIGVYTILRDKGFPAIDMPVPNKEGEYLSKAEDGTSYMVKHWFQGKECEIYSPGDLQESVCQLARLHKAMRGIALESPAGEKETLREEYERHNRELRKVREFMNRRSVKIPFESTFLQSFDKVYAWAGQAVDYLGESGIQGLYDKVKTENHWIHGDYNYHNLIMCRQGVAVTNFEHARRDIQMADLYYFLRKALEKCRYDERTGYQILSAYQSVFPIGKEEREYLAVRIAYPEKIWKAANAYYHSNKAWISAKNYEKLQMAIDQMEEKKRFLENILAFHLE